MHILIVNDDGIEAAGLAALEEAALAVSDEVSVVAPTQEHSAQSHAITVREPILVNELQSQANLIRYSIQGTPTDCVRLAILELCPKPPGLVLSGINHGANMGWEIFFSGTVAAAAEAYSFGIPSVAFSLASWSKCEFQTASRVAKVMIENFVALGQGEPFFYNVNIPPISYNDIKGVRLTRTEPNVKGDGYVSREAPDGRRYFWATWGDRHTKSSEITDPSYDVVAIRENYVSLTKLKYDVSASLEETETSQKFTNISFK